MGSWICVVRGGDLGVRSLSSQIMNHPPEAESLLHGDTEMQSKVAMLLSKETQWRGAEWCEEGRKAPLV
jgi:hypothetical protein